uniref:ShKT domain-containing protein n=1 Tax=Caenorhabditis japonica TaxID=281687 RepID=A0A8R1IGY2_CAEJA
MQPSRTIFLFFASFFLLVTGYNVPPPTGIHAVSEVDTMIRQCFQTACKEWMAECHWYCDSIKGASFLRRCKDCLSFRGQQCMDCFEL